MTILIKKTTTICGKRLCKVSRMNDVVQNSIVHDGDNIEIVSNTTSSYKSSAVIIACAGGMKKKVFADNAVVQLKLPKDCEVSNEHLRIDKVLTAKLEP